MAIQSEIINATNGITINVTVQEQDVAWIIALSIAVITLIGVVWSNLQTRKSNRMLEENLKNRLRPALQILDIRPHTVGTPDGHNVVWEEYVNTNPKPTITEVSFTGTVKNVGSVPALEIKSKWIQRNSPIKREDLENGKQDPSFPLGVSDEYPFTSRVSWAHYNNSKTVPYYLGLKFEYDTPQGIEEIGKIWKIKFNQILTEDYWFKKAG